MGRELETRAITVAIIGSGIITATLLLALAARVDDVQRIDAVLVGIVSHLDDTHYVDRGDYHPSAGRM